MLSLKKISTVLGPLIREYQTSAWRIELTYNGVFY